MEFSVAGTTEYEKSGRGGRPPESAGGYPGSDLHLWDVLSVWADRCAVTENVNISWEGW